jgi:tRNA A37 methylthiotransferase MiaB
VDEDEVRARVAHVTGLVEELTAQRADDRVGQTVEVLVESVGDEVVGRAAHQGPEVDGTTTLVDHGQVAVGDVVIAKVVASEGVDLVARP